MRCDVFKKDKEELLEKSIAMDKTIKKFSEELKFVVSSNQRFIDIIEVKVHRLLEGSWHGEAEVRARYPDYLLDMIASPSQRSSWRRWRELELRIPKGRGLSTLELVVGILSNNKKDKTRKSI